MIAPTKTIVLWDKRDSGEWVAHVGHATFRYTPSDKVMVWRGKTYHGIAEKDINQFVENRRDRE